jgi:hypothetical protein
VGAPWEAGVSLPDRVYRGAWRLGLLLLVFAVVVPVTFDVLSSTVGAAARTTGHLAASGIGGILFVAFVVGLGVRLVRLTLDPGVRRRRQADRERMRRTVRRPAEEVPAHGEPRRTAPDEDPALPFGGAE